MKNHNEGYLNLLNAVESKHNHTGHCERLGAFVDAIHRNPDPTAILQELRLSLGVSITRLRYYKYSTEPSEQLVSAACAGHAGQERTFESPFRSGGVVHRAADESSIWNRLAFHTIRENRPIIYQVADGPLRQQTISGYPIFFVPSGSPQTRAVNLVLASWIEFPLHSGTVPIGKLSCCLGARPEDLPFKELGRWSAFLRCAAAEIHPSLDFKKTPQQLQLLGEVARLRSRPALWRWLTTKVPSIMECEHATALTYEPNGIGNVFVLQASSVRSSWELVGTTHEPVHCGWDHWVVRNKCPLRLSDVGDRIRLQDQLQNHSPELSQTVRSQRIPDGDLQNSVMYVPIANRLGAMGVIRFVDKNHEHGFTSQDQAFGLELGEAVCAKLSSLA